jgi:hypothetical protein
MTLQKIASEKKESKFYNIIMINPFKKYGKSAVLSRSIYLGLVIIHTFSETKVMVIILSFSDDCSNTRSVYFESQATRSLF